MLMLVNRDTGRGLGVTLFESEEAMRRGADESLAKPFAFRELEEKIARLIDGPPKPPPAA